MQEGTGALEEGAKKVEEGEGIKLSLRRVSARGLVAPAACREKTQVVKSTSVANHEANK